MVNKLIISIFAIFMLCAGGSCHHPGTSLIGAGATFPYPYYNKIFAEYQLQTGREVLYNPIGSTGGINLIMEGSLDFGASDAFFEL